jgi:hypothetical protein
MLDDDLKHFVASHAHNLTSPLPASCSCWSACAVLLQFVAKGARFDYNRLTRMAAFGFIFHGTISHFFYNKLDEVIPGKTPLAIAEKVFTDQVPIH